VVVACRFKFKAGEYGIAIHQLLLFISFESNIKQEVLADNLELLSFFCIKQCGLAPLK